jgi:hypothetical protein
MRNAEYIQSRSPNGAPATYRPDPRFGPPDQWQNRREMRLELKYLFQAGRGAPRTRFGTSFLVPGS